MNALSTTSRKDRFQGALLGLAAGDAVGTTVEFEARGSFPPVTDMTGGGPFDLKPGQWTDDTSMALCLGQSLLDRCAFDPVDQLKKYVRWWKEGYMSSTERCFDIGNTTRGALRRFGETGEPESGSIDPHSAGNGSIMRLAPVPMFYLFDPPQALEKCALSSRTTHGAATAIDACRYLGALLLGALAGESKEILLADHYAPLPGYWKQYPLCAEIDEVANGSFRRKSAREICGSGYVVSSLEAALWAFGNSRSFAEGCLKAVNLGEDADTTAAVYGQIAAGLYGHGNRPHGNCYWAEPDRLMAGEYPGNKDESTAQAKLRKTVEAGVTFFLDLTEAGEYGLKPYAPFLPTASPVGKKVEYRRFPVRDTGVPGKREMQAILDEIQNSLAQGHIVYVHCWGGVGRTGTVIGCWLRQSGMTGEQALNQVTQFWRTMSEAKLLRHPESPEFEAQKQFIDPTSSHWSRACR